MLGVVGDGGKICLTHWHSCIPKPLPSTWSIIVKGKETASLVSRNNLTLIY